MSSAAPPPPTPKRGCGCGCLSFLLKGCLVLLVIGIVIAIWSRFPSFGTPQTSRFALWPAKTVKASSMLAPKDRQKLDPYSESHYFYPIQELPGWFAVAKLRADEVQVISLLMTTESEDFRWEGETIYFETTGSAVMLIDVKGSAADVLRRVPAVLVRPETLGNVPVLGFPSPSRKEGAERWYWAAPTEHTVAIGGRAAIEEVLAIAAGKKEGILGRRVMRPMLRDVESASSFEMDLVPLAREQAKSAGHDIMRFIYSIPGISLFASARGKANALQKLPSGECIQKMDLQFDGRLSATVFWAFFELTAQKPESLAEPGKPEEVPEAVDVGRDAGLVKVHMRYSAERCRAVDQAEERVQLFPQ